MRQPGHSTIGQIERGAAEIEQGVVVAAQHLDRAGRDRAVAMHQRRGEAADAVGVGGGLAKDLVVLGEQAQRDSGPRAGVGIASHLHGQPVGAAPDRGRKIGAQDHLHAGRRIRRAVAGRGAQRVEAGAGTGERIGHWQRGVCAAVRLPVRYVRAALPDNASGLFADPLGVPGLDRLAEPGAPHEADDVALGQARESQFDAGEVDSAQPDGRGLAARQQEHARVEVDARAAIAHGDVQCGVLHQAEAGLAGHAGAQHDPRGRAGGQAGDADLIALARHGRALCRRIEAHPVLGVEIVATGGGDGEIDAGARRFGLRLGGDAADKDAGGAAGFIQLLHDRLVIRRAFGSGLQGLDRLRRPVQRSQRVGHQQQRRHFGCTAVGGGEVLPGGLEGAAGLGRRAAHLRLGQRQPLRRGRIA